MNNLILKAEKTHSLNKEEITSILSNNNIDNVLFSSADRVRQKYVGNEIYLRALIEFSNICQNNCLYCGLRAQNSQIQRYALTEEKLISTAQIAIDAGFKTIVLQSGESSAISTKTLCKIIKKIKQNDIAITLSIGEKEYNEYKDLKNAGADRFLLRIETSDKNLYKKLHPNMDFDNRIRCLKNIKELGYETGTGCLVGLPGQSIGSLADDILFFKSIDADMIGIGPFIPHPQTPLCTESKGSLITALKVMALTRLLLPFSNIPATTAMETIEAQGQLKALQCGANVIMPNVTDEVYRNKYEIYPNKSACDTTINNFKKILACKYAPTGRTIKMSKGNSLNYTKKHR